MTQHQSDPTSDLLSGEAAFRRIRPLIDALPRERWEKVTANVQSGAVLGLALVQKLKVPGRKEALRELPSRFFDAGELDRLEDYARALLYLRTARLKHDVQSTTARVPGDLLDQALRLRSTMLKVGAYFFDDDPVLGSELEDIRRGRGYEDLALDLLRLADIYLAQETVLKQDVLFYRREDAASADRLAQQIFESLGMGPAPQVELTPAAWTLFRRCYDRIRDAWRFAFQDEPFRDEIPSLFSTSRRGRTRELREEALPIRAETNESSAPAQPLD